MYYYYEPYQDHAAALKDKKIQIYCNLGQPPRGHCAEFCFGIFELKEIFAEYFCIYIPSRSYLSHGHGFF